MRIQRIAVWAGVVMAACLVVPAYAADIAKIGVVDLQRVFTESESGKSVQARLQQRGNEMQAGLQELGAKIDEITEQLTKEAMVLSKEKREEKQRELDIKRYDFQSLQKKYQSEFRELEAKEVDKLQKDIFSLAEQIGKKEGYLLIIDKGAAIYYPKSIDLTDQLIEEYNKKGSASQ